VAAGDVAKWANGPNLDQDRGTRSPWWRSPLGRRVCAEAATGWLPTPNGS
jgi:hypothetical protein